MELKTRPNNPISIAIVHKDIILALTLCPYLKGFSIRAVVSQASTTASKIAEIRSGNDGCLPSIIHKNEIKGQCQRYKEKLIKPNQTNVFCDSITLLIQALDPARMIAIEPKTGINAHQPG